MARMVLNESHWIGDKIITEDEKIVSFFIYKNYEQHLKNSIVTLNVTRDYHVHNCLTTKAQVDT